MENRITIITIREGIAENEAALLWEQLLKLINGFKRDIGEEPLTEEGQQRLRQAMKDGRITFFLAFYMEPEFRRKGIAHMLAQAAQKWSRENGLASMTVTCAPCDEGMYQALGFELRLGTTFAHMG